MSRRFKVAFSIAFGLAAVLSTSLPTFDSSPIGSCKSGANGPRG